jgi:hypothetical protein
MEIQIARKYNVSHAKTEYYLAVDGDTASAVKYATPEEALDAVVPPLSDGEKESLLNKLNQGDDEVAFSVPSR